MNGRKKLAAAVHVAIGVMAAIPLSNVAQNVDLAELGTTHPGFRIDGINDRDYSGRSVSGAGDVNGDGLDDVIIGAAGADPDGKYAAGESYVVFGKADGTPVDLAALGGGGFRIEGIDADDRAGISVSGAGDVNGDGLDDLIIGAQNARSSAGESYVVFGKADSNTVDLATLGTGGFRIDGADPVDLSGFSVSGAGDVNGDGLDDVIIGARYADPGGRSAAGESYVVFGKADSNTVDLAALGAGGFRINGIDPDDQAGRSVSRAGDVNGDGLDDLIIGAWFADSGDTDAGESYVVFGKADGNTVELAALGTGGFRIDGIDFFDLSGKSVSGAGDVNGDGLADVIIGAYRAAVGGNVVAGESYVVFGKADSTTVNLAVLGAGGFRIDGVDGFDKAGYSVSGAGDVNGDGLADVIIGATGGAPGGNTNAGESYVVFGKADSTAVDLASLGTGGFRIDGINASDGSGRSVSGAGDVDGDGLADLIVGTSFSDAGGVMYAGESYVVFGDQTAVDTGSVPPPMGLAAGDRLGGAVATDGKLFAVGLPNADVGSPDSGRVVIYRNEGTTLVEDAVIDVPANHFATNFGASLALEGGRLVVGAPGTIPSQAKGNTALQAAIFERANNGGWTFRKPLSPMNGNDGDEFGASVSLDDGMVVVGAPGDAEGIDSGAVHVYKIDEGENIVGSRKLKPTGGNSGARFGESVATHAGRVAVGSPGGKPAGALATPGLVHVYNQIGNNLADLTPDDPVTGSGNDGDEFGASIDLDSGRLLAGSPGDDGDAMNGGAAWVLDPENLTQIRRVVPVNPQPGAALGRAVALNATALAAGAPGLDGGAGGAFRFDAVTLAQTRLTRALAGQLNLGSALALSSEALVAGAPGTASETGAAVVQRNPALIHRSGFE
ncbi:MAG: hypothetical protein R3200_05830 [Xanthomonadales bacterium]|nr:hypothetical protein [Xanthomonadales bacterium]